VKEYHNGIFSSLKRLKYHCFAKTTQ